jgi:hypothetical protein
LARSARVAALALASALAATGCGEGGGVSSGATVSVYVTAPLCAGAKRELARAGARAGDVQVGAICVASERDRGRLSLATLGANARRATEDSAAIAYLEGPEAAAARFAHPILESAGIPWISAGSGKAAMARLLKAVKESSSSSLRSSIRESVRSQ